MFVRGYKTWCEEVSAQLREELGSRRESALDPRELARLLDVDLWTPHDVPGLPSEVRRRLTTAHADCWSAVTISSGLRTVVIFNPAHSSARQASDITHELAHILLGHKPGHMFMAPSGAALRTHDRDQEAEANWLCGSLLLPREALVSIRRRRITEETACAEYGVSKELLRYRLNATGVNFQFRRIRGG